MPRASSDPVGCGCGVSGLADLVRVIGNNRIRSIAIPPLGCGLGGLDWNVVRPMIVDALSPVDDLLVEIHEP